MKHKNYSPGLRTRELPPLPQRTKNGVALLCPFCQPTHPLIPGKANNCGTEIRVTAVQTIISARTARQEGLACVKCRKTGQGEMVRYMNGYIHAQECAPEIKLLREIPKYSKTAEWVYRLPEKVRAVVEKRTGMVQMVHELTPEGEETGAIQGYFFNKKAA
jgi:hypothetical protein